VNSIVDLFDKCSWKPTAGIRRAFVKHPASEESPGSYCSIKCGEDRIRLSVLIPTSDADRGGYFRQLLDQINRQTYTFFELIIVKGDSRQGRAINIGAALAKGKYLLTLDDDTSLPDVETFQKMADVMEKYPTIGIAGGNNVVPDQADFFVRRAMKEIPRRSWEPVDTITESDLAEHPCMVMRTKEFKAVGGENELIPRGLDPYLREQFRKIDKRVVVVPQVIYHHLPPDSLAKLLRQFYRNGWQASYTRRNYPQWIIETPAGHGQFKSNVSFSRRILRFPGRLFEALIALKFIWFLSEVAYGAGYFGSMLFEKPLKGDHRKKNV